MVEAVLQYAGQAQFTATFPLIRYLMPERDRIENALFVTIDLQSKEGHAVFTKCLQLMQ